MFDAEFGDEFWLSEGEPYDASELSLDSEGRPTSFWSALELALCDKVWVSEAKKVMGECGMSAEQLFDRARQVNTCNQLHAPIRIYLSTDLSLWIEVY